MSKIHTGDPPKRAVLDRDLRRIRRRPSNLRAASSAALSAVQNRFSRTCQHYPSVTVSSIPIRDFFQTTSEARSTKLKKIVAPYRSQAGSGHKAVSGPFSPAGYFRRCSGFGLLPGEHYCRFPSAFSQSRNQLPCDCFVSVPRFCFRYNPYRIALSSLASSNSDTTDTPRGTQLGGLLKRLLRC